MSADPLHDERLGLAEEFGRFFDEHGLPRTEGRILGWLVVCDPPEQSADDLAVVLALSRGGVSMAMRMLVRADAVERVSVPGSRKHFYRLRPGLWRREIERRVQEARRSRDLAAAGLERLGAAPEEQLRRLQDMREMYDFLARGYEELSERWRSTEKERIGGDHDAA